METAFLQLFILLDVFVAGILATMALRHAKAHFRPNTHDLEKTRPSAATQGAHLPPAVRQQMLEEAQANFQLVLNRAAKELQKDLESTASEIKKQLEHHGSEAVREELERYRTHLSQLQQQTEQVMTGAEQAASEHQTELAAKAAEYQATLKAKMEEEIAAEKQRLIDQLDTKLADAVAAFLVETLQHDVDLGAQSAYLNKLLNEHKAEIIEEVKQ